MLQRGSMADADLAGGTNVMYHETCVPYHGLMLKPFPGVHLGCNTICLVCYIYHIYIYMQGLYIYIHARTGDIDQVKFLAPLSKGELKS